MWLLLNQEWKNKASEKSPGIVEAFALAILLFACFTPLFSDQIFGSGPWASYGC